MSIVNVDKIKSGIINRKPFAWCELHDLISDNIRDLLVREFPQDGFQTIVKTSGNGKSYKMSLRPLIRIGQSNPHDPEGLHPVWLEFCQQIMSDEYREALEVLTGRSLQECFIEATFWRYYEDCFLSPHTDEPEKNVTQLFYLNKNWDASRGGGLEIYGRDLERGPEKIVAPDDNTSVVLIRSDASWHAVRPLDADYRRDRISIQIVFWNAMRQS